MTSSVDHSDVIISDLNSNNSKSLISPFPDISNGVVKISRPSMETQHSVISEDITADQRVTFNVGGVIFQTTRKTCRNRPCKRFKLSDRDFLAQHYDATRMEYFFDRDPEVFRSVLNYWRTGSLHLPLTVCGPHVKSELEFWGLKELDIQPCCWDSFNSWMKTVESLSKLERDRHPDYLVMDGGIVDGKPKSRRQRWSLVVWNFLTDPSYSLPAKIYAYVSLVIVLLAIFSFCASTHKAFVVNNDDDHHNATMRNNALTIGNDKSTPTNAPLKIEPRARGKDIITDSNIHPALFYIDVFCLAFFTLEYLIRLTCASRRCRFVISISAIVDLLAILPDYVEFIVYSIDSKSSSAFVDFMPFLRLMRALRIFRLVRRVPGLWIMLYTLKASFKELSLMLVFLLVGMLFFSSIVYFVDDPKVFKSIPHGFWWAIVTMTTVGYGDVAPVTALGQLVGSCTAICGVLLVGFTIPALVSNFIAYCRHVEFVMKKEQLLAEHYFKSLRDVDDPDDVERDCLLSTDTIVTDAPST